MIATYRTISISERIPDECLVGSPQEAKYEWINVHSWHAKDTPYFELCPYVLQTDGHEQMNCGRGIIFENLWQSCKVFRTVYDIEVYPHARLQGRPEYLQWKYVCANKKGRETHLDEDNELTPEYFRWRRSIQQCRFVIRYPNGRHRTTQTLFSVVNDNEGNERRYDYLEARKRIYVGEYTRLVRKLPIYWTLVEKLKQGKNLLITEIDVPAAHKKGSYGRVVDEKGYYHADLTSLQELMDDPSEPFGHGLCLARALLQDMQL